MEWRRLQCACSVHGLPCTSFAPQGLLGNKIHRPACLLSTPRCAPPTRPPAVTTPGLGALACLSQLRRLDLSYTPLEVGVCVPGALFFLRRCVDKLDGGVPGGFSFAPFILAVAFTSSRDPQAVVCCGPVLPGAARR